MQDEERSSSSISSLNTNIVELQGAASGLQATIASKESAAAAADIKSASASHQVVLQKHSMLGCSVHSQQVDAVWLVGISQLIYMPILCMCSADALMMEAVEEPNMTK